VIVSTSQDGSLESPVKLDEPQFAGKTVFATPISRVKFVSRFEPADHGGKAAWNETHEKEYGVLRTLQRSKPTIKRLQDIVQESAAVVAIDSQYALDVGTMTRSVTDLVKHEFTSISETKHDMSPLATRRDRSAKLLRGVRNPFAAALPLNGNHLHGLDHHKKAAAQILPSPSQPSREERLMQRITDLHQQTDLSQRFSEVNSVEISEYGLAEEWTAWQSPDFVEGDLLCRDAEEHVHIGRFKDTADTPIIKQVSNSRLSSSASQNPIFQVKTSSPRSTTTDYIRHTLDRVTCTEDAQPTTPTWKLHGSRTCFGSSIHVFNSPQEITRHSDKVEVADSSLIVTSQLRSTESLDLGSFESQVDRSEIPQHMKKEFRHGVIFRNPRAKPQADREIAGKTCTVHFRHEADVVVTECNSDLKKAHSIRVLKLEHGGFTAVLSDLSFEKQECWSNDTFAKVVERHGESLVGAYNGLRGLGEQTVDEQLPIDSHEPAIV